VRRSPAVVAVLVALLGSTLGLHAANPVVAVGPGDVTPPTLLAAVEITGPVTPVSDVILAFDDALDATTMPAGSDLADIDVEVGGLRDAATSAELTYVGFAEPGQLASFVTVHLATSFTDGTDVTVAYLPHGNPIRDQAGNAAAASDASALLWFEAPAFEVMFALADGAYGANRVGIILPDAPMLPLPDPSAFSVTRNSDPPVPATRVSVFPGVGGRILDLELPICLAPGDAVSVAYAKPALNPLRNSANTEADSAAAVDVFVQLQPDDSSCGIVGAGGGSVTTGTVPSADNPVTATVTVPAAATISIAGVTTEQLPTADFNFLSDSLSISVVAPAGTFDAGHPISLTFRIDGPTLRAAAATEQSLAIFRNGALVGDCPGSVVASPDPCVSARVPATVGADYATFTVLTSAASKWTFGAPVPFGFRSPVDQSPVVNVVNAGRGIPVRFSLGGDRGLNIFAPGYPKSQVVSCDGAAPTDVIEQTVTAGSSSLSYDTLSATYTYVWKTDKSWAKAPYGPCRNLIIQFDGGSRQVARFRFN
jgi:hypothetical protein